MHYLGVMYFDTVHRLYARDLQWDDGCRYESNCPLVGPGTVDGLPSVGVFLKDPSPYLREFRRKPRKTPNG